MGRRVFGSGGGSDATDPPSRLHGRAAGVTVLLLVLAVSVGAAVLVIDHHGLGDSLGSRAAAASMPTAPLPPTRLTGLPPRTIANGTKPLSITLSGPVAAGSPAPTLKPAVAGAWADAGNSAVFTPVSTLQPCATYTLTVWANTVAQGHSRLGHRRSIGLRVACPLLASLQQALARLGYLGAAFHPLYAVRIPPGPETRRDAAVHAFHPPRGVLAPDPSSAPRVETGHLDEITRGALTVYQSDRGLEPTGEPDYATWASLLAAEAANRRDPKPYTWVSVSESLPETLEVHRGDHVALSTPVNTGVPGAETPQGVFPIFSRFVSTTMSGTDVDGTKYVVPDVPWVNYFNGGDAVHGYPRASYGFPQSNGCVELPIEAAHTAFGMLGVGDVVTVTG